MDRPDEFDVPSAPDGSSGSSGGRRVAVEERYRFEYYDELRAAVRDDRVSAETPDAIARSVPAETSWDAAADRFRERWAEHLERWPSAERAPVDRSADPEGSWRGDSGRFLDRAANAEVEERYEQIADAERTVLTPAMREIEACDPERKLVGFEHRLKGLDRLKDKVAEDISFKARGTEAALSSVKDAVRYTFEYDASHYAAGVCADLARLKNRGFEEVELRNSWASDTYRGINSRWRDPATGLLYEVQFHTSQSFEAKQLTHAAYERQRNPTTTDAEREELSAFQLGVSRRVQPPADAMRIPDFP